MPLFPDMPLPVASAAAPAVPGVPGQVAVPAQEVSRARGTLPGMDATLLGLFANYNPGELGVAELSERFNLTFPYDLWAWYAFYKEALTENWPAGSTTTVTIYTVPTNRRLWFQGFSCERSSGDNLMNQLMISYPTGYYEGTDFQPMLLDLTSPATILCWPDEGGRQASTRWMPGPILLEPGTQVQLKPSGAGAAVTKFEYSILGRMTDLVRDSTPGLS